MLSENNVSVPIRKKILLTFILFLQIASVVLDQDEDIPHNEVKNWALKFGVNLWQYGKMMTRMNELQRNYHDVDLNVIRKDGLILIRDIANEVKNRMEFKTSSVMRIMDSAEQAALTPQTDNGQTFRYYNSKRLNSFGPDGRPVEGTREMVLTPSLHFDHLPVNTSLSSILLPSNVIEEVPEVQNAIQWSDHLDPIFNNNHEYDPTLSWQFFGSSSGFLRRYPAIAWPPEDMSTIWQRPRNNRNIYDFRTSAWYINAVTSPKDIVILVDNSGSMSGHRANLARGVVEAILDTLSDDDYINLYKFSDTTEESVPCFRDMLVQANNENKRSLKDSLNNLKAENIANFSSALITGFEILHKYNRTGQGCQCNQAIMIITDSAPSSYRDIFKTYNFPHRPVRIFTYLLGKDSSSATEMHWMACANKGYYTRIQNFHDIKRNVLHYIEVMARPLVMYQVDHPITWSPIYLGAKGGEFPDEKIDQLMTTVSIPVFDRRNHSIKIANVLGVVGADVSITDTMKLVPRYKLGVNGYPFLINNNGHVLYHPDLRPLVNNELYEDTLEPRYLSVDLTEVELVENNNAPRENHSALLDLRHDMIDQKEGEAELSVRIHYDRMRRVAIRRQKYFFHPVSGTPFTLGVAIPEGYGMYELSAEQEIKHSQKNVTDYFKGTNWRVHPDWVYCEYLNAQYAEQFKTPEERVLHFLLRSRRPGWKWMSVRPRAHYQREHRHVSPKIDKDAYYCDKTLLQSLVLDAMVTEGIEKHSFRPRLEDKNQGYEIFGLMLSFVATRSGLLRWTNLTNVEMEEPKLNARAMDESWYKRAVDQHSIEPESFVFSVPFDVGSNGKPLVTATHAVFVEHKGHRAPAAVVGLQYQHSTLAMHFLNITSKCTGKNTGQSDCLKTCASDKLDCYVLDNNGFIIISENNEHTGRFFGQIDGTIMDSLVQDRIYKKVAVYDYQAGCSNSKYFFSGKASRIKFMDPAFMFFNFMVKMVIFLLTKVHHTYSAAVAYAQDEGKGGVMDLYPDYDNFEQYTGEDVIDDQDPIIFPPSNTYTPSFIPPFESDPLEGVDMRQFEVRPCDQKVDLYILQPDRLNTSGQSSPLKGKLTNCHVTGCERPFSVQKIPHSNLILLVVDTMCPCGNKQLSISPQELVYNPGNEGCSHKPKDSLYRRRPPKCINYHPEEIEIHICGTASVTTVSVSIATVILMHSFCIFLL